MTGWRGIERAAATLGKGFKAGNDGLEVCTGSGDPDGAANLRLQIYFFFRPTGQRPLCVSLPQRS